MNPPAAAGAQSDPEFWLPGEPSSSRAAIVCEFGHVHDDSFDQLRGPVEEAMGFCPKCGTHQIVRCGSCRKRIRGKPRDRRLAAVDYIPPSFCDHCGAPHPWATREDRITQLQQIVRTESDGPRYKAAHAALDALRHEGLKPRREARLWKKVQKAAPELTSRAWPVVQPLLTAYLKAKLHLDDAGKSSSK